MLAERRRHGVLNICVAWDWDTKSRSGLACSGVSQNSVSFLLVFIVVFRTRLLVAINQQG